MSLNPVEKTMQVFWKDWMRFSDDRNHRLLVWEIPEVSERLVDCFIECQKHDNSFKSEDVFVQFSTVFENSIQYARDIKAEWLKQLNDLEIKGSEERQNLADDLPHTCVGTKQLVQHTRHLLLREDRSLVLVLVPAIPTEDSYFQQWVQRFLETRLPVNIRVLVIDTTENPKYPELTNQFHRDIQRSPIAINAWTIAKMTFAEEEAKNDSAKYRNMMVSIMGSLSEGSANDVNVLSRDALNFARERGWVEQEVALRQIVAGAYMKEKNYPKAKSVYSAATGFCRSELAGNPLQYKLSVQSLMGEASAYLAIKDFDSAVTSYNELARMSQENSDTAVLIDAERMLAFCSVQIGDRQSAIQHGIVALKASKGIEKDQLGATNGSSAAVDLLSSIDKDTTQGIVRNKLQSQSRAMDLLDKAEVRAATLEANPDKRIEEGILFVLTEQEEDSDKKSEQDLKEMINSAKPEFIKAFVLGREIFGKQWPLKDAKAIPISRQQVQEFRGLSL